MPKSVYSRPSLADVFDATEGDDIVIDGVSVWRSEWKPTGERVQLTAYGRTLWAPLYQAASGPHVARFAAYEVSNGRWVFARPLERG